MNIGITLTESRVSKVWNNGITQNALNLFFLFNNIKQYDTYLVDPLLSENKQIVLDKSLGYILYSLDSLKSKLDLIITLGVDMKTEQYNYFKNKGCKIVQYHCGTSYLIDMENVLFKDDNTDLRISKQTPDEVWIIPQNYETNKYYFESLYKVECKCVPFVWSSYFIDDFIKNDIEIDVYYKPNKILKNVSSFEPNINIVKYAMYNIIITEKLYNQNKNLINKFYITNSQKIRTNKLFVNIMNMYEVVKDGIASFEDRFPIPFFLGKYTDVVISHQMLNPLNYIYLDVLYLNYPLVHNADMIKNAGYYYDGFNAEKGKEQLLYALTEHDNNLEKYQQESKKTLDLYLPTNKKNINIYKKLIKELFK